MVERVRYVLDTGPLVEYLFLCYEQQSGGRACWRRCFRPVSFFGPDDIAAFERFLRLASERLVTTSGVFAEIEGHVRRAENACGQEAPNLRRTIWSQLVDLVRECRIAEEMVHIVQLDGDVLREYGPVDAVVLQLALRGSNDFDRCVLVTSDGPLVAKSRHER